ncbi:MAG: OmpA/MotB domain protein [Sediminibacterium sp.]|nr:OmpA/MotB domain protein [Sediminibacterium sp.]
MASKKYILVIALVVLIQSISFAQTDWGWDWKDSSKVAVKSLPQYTEFLNNTYPYPPKPRNMWEMGISLGKANIFGDVANYGFGYGAGLSFRKALGHAVSVRAGLLFQKSEGIDTKLWSTDKNDGFLSPTLGYRGFTSYGVYAAYVPNSANPALKAFVPNYKTQSWSGTLDFIFSLNALDFYRGNPKWDWYLFGGYALVNSDIDTRLALGGNGATPFNFTTINFNDSKDNIQTAVNNLLSQASGSGSKENYTNGPVRAKRHDIGSSNNFLLHHALSYGAGFSYKLSPRVNIGFEDRVINAFTGDLDAVNTGNNDIMNYGSLHLNVTLGNKAKNVEPLWWLNPLNYAYNELNSPKHMRLPKVVLPDADGDGVTDQFDLEPNTPRGCPVDSHGVSKDTDGDGVPDCRDKEILTLLKCFPVNSDGVGTCPEPACCKEIRDLLAARPVEKAPECTIGNLPSVQFKGNAKLSKAAESVLANAAASIKANPNCNIKVIGYGVSSKAAQQLSWERVNAVIKYLTEKQGISESRLLFYYGQDGDSNTVDLQGTMDAGPNTVPAPHPNLRKN